MNAFPHRDSLRKSLRLARKLGCDVSDLRGTGEVIVCHSDLPGRVRINGRRKCCPMSLQKFLVQLGGLEEGLA